MKRRKGMGRQGNIILLALLSTCGLFPGTWRPESACRAQAQVISTRVHICKSGQTPACAFMTRMSAGCTSTSSGERCTPCSSVSRRRTVLVLDTPPALLTIDAKGRYRVRVADTAATEAVVADGSLSFKDLQGKTVYVTKRSACDLPRGRKERRGT